jgi:MFS family permease
MDENHTAVSLWRNGDFMQLWVGQTVSKLGSSITGSALPLAAMLNLGAGAPQMGLITALEAAPVLLVGLFAGAWVDRRSKRPIMIAADLGRAVVLGSIPLAAALGTLQLEYIYLVALLAGSIVQRMGLGKTLIFSALGSSLLALIIPLARGPQMAATAILMADQLIQDVAFAVFFINELSLRQVVAPRKMLGRLNASNQVLVAGLGPFGALMGGALGGWIGLRPTLAIAAFGMALSVLWLVFSPVRAMQEHPGIEGRSEQYDSKSR